MANSAVIFLITLGAIAITLVLGAILALILFVCDKQDEIHNIHRCHSCHNFECRLLGGYCYLKEEKCDPEQQSCDKYEKEDGAA